jgi:hypothetical protein
VILPRLYSHTEHTGNGKESFGTPRYSALA